LGRGGARGRGKAGSKDLGGEPRGAKKIEARAKGNRKKKKGVAENS